MGRYHYVFPKWSNMLLPAILLAGVLVPPYVVFVVAFGFSPMTTDVGYMPHQPVPYSHELHAGKLGIDCRYCHNTVEFTDQANIPPTQTCMNCHTQILKDSEKIKPLAESYTSGLSVQWKRVHDLPQYAYFSHQAHVTRGVSCVECHGRVDRMPEVYQQEPLSMGWCLDCHREPDARLRDPQLVFDLGWSFENDTHAKARFPSAAAYGAFWRAQNNLNPSQDCSTCHR
jgi:hypothetical protein